MNMPGGNRKGPQGLGPLTGRGLGNCSGRNSPDPIAYGRGFANARGFGRGYGRGGVVDTAEVLIKVDGDINIHGLSLLKNKPKI